MYIAKKERTDKNGIKVFYLYLAESKRIDGKVKNIQRYVTSFKEEDVKDKDKFNVKIKDLSNKFSNNEVNIILKKIDELFYVG